MSDVVGDIEKTLITPAMYHYSDNKNIPCNSRPTGFEA